MTTFLLLLLVSVIAATSAATDKVVCYHGNWAVYRSGNGKFDIDHIDPYLCTHIIYSFIGLNADGTVRIMDTNTAITQNGFQKFNALRNKNPNLKTLVAIGGWNEGSTTYSNVVASASLRATFISSALNFVQTYGFNGFDLDWEYPGQRGGSSADKANFVTLLQEMKPLFEQNGLLLTAAVAAASFSVDISYNVPALSTYLDFINVMTYDLHGSWDGVTGQNAALYPSSIDVTETQRSLNIDACISGWIAKGADPSKLVMGVGTYGRSFTLSSSANTNLGAPTISGGTPGKYTGETGFLGYNEICENELAGWTVVWDDEQKVPYSYKGNQWVGYDNPRSVALKVDYAKSKGLGGVMVWSLETDDFRGICGYTYPILNQIKTSLGSSSPGSSSGSGSGTTSTTTTTTTQATVPEQSGGQTVCTSTGYIRDVNDCSIFYYCAQSGTGYTMSQFVCPSGLYYDVVLGVCNWPSEVDC